MLSPRAGYTISNTLNNAQQITQIQSSWVDSTHPQYLAQNITYTPFGALNTLLNGCTGSSCTQTQETYSYNNRLQVAQIQLGTSGNPTGNFSLAYNHSLPGGATPPGCPVSAQGSGNNGNVIGYTYTDAANNSMTHSALYVYDGLNRLACAQATGNSTYNLAFNSDRYGNMTCTTNQYTSGLRPNWNYNAANNQNTVYTYDAAGNLTGDGSHSYQWDGEGKMKSVDGGATFNFVYNALGQQVRETVGGWNHMYDVLGKFSGRYGATGWLTEMVYTGGRPLVDYSQYSPPGAYFIHPNALGSAGVNTNQTGLEYQDLLFYPWGQVWKNVGWMDWSYAGFDYRIVLTFNGVDFDPTVNRMYSPDNGRWMSPDPANAGADPSDPQTWNAYAYVRNNPTTNVDPTGEYFCGPTDQNGAANCVTDTEYSGNPDAYKGYTYYQENPVSQQAGVMPTPTPEPLPPPIPPLPEVGGEVGAGSGAETGGAAGGAATVGLAALDIGLAIYDVYQGYRLYQSYAHSKNAAGVEPTPATNPSIYEPVRGTPAKRNKITGEIWVPDKSGHYGGLHYEVYRNIREYDNRNRDRAVDPAGNTIKQY